MSTPLTSAQSLYWDQEPRLRGKTDELLDLLRDGAWHSNYDCFLAGGLSFQGRLCSLRKLGYQIDSRYVSPGHWDYMLKDWTKPTPKQPTLSKPQLRAVADLETAIERNFGSAGLERVRQDIPELYRPDRRPQPGRAEQSDEREHESTVSDVSAGFSGSQRERAHALESHHLTREGSRYLVLPTPRDLA